MRIIDADGVRLPVHDEAKLCGHGDPPKISGKSLFNAMPESFREQAEGLRADHSARRGASLELRAASL
jgi:hypothetical protein